MAHTVQAVLAAQAEAAAGGSGSGGAREAAPLPGSGGGSAGVWRGMDAGALLAGLAALDPLHTAYYAYLLGGRGEDVGREGVAP